ncbi:putative 5-methyltetrahydropteroyltriglutamate--homocysteine S-methyltransferase [Helianthus anomalus]
MIRLYELKFVLDSFWGGKSSAEDLQTVAADLRSSIWKLKLLILSQKNCWGSDLESDVDPENGVADDTGIYMYDSVIVSIWLFRYCVIKFKCEVVQRNRIHIWVSGILTTHSLYRKSTNRRKRTL